MRFAPCKNNSKQDAATQKLGQGPIKMLVRRVCSAFIILGQNKSIIKRADLTKIIKREEKDELRIPPLAVRGILNLACSELQEIFGMRVFEVDASRDKLLLVNSRADYNEYRNYTPEESEELTVLFLMMVAIFTTADGLSTDLELREAVKPILENEDDFKRILDSLLKKLYLTQSRDPNRPDAKLITWGPRAYAETNPDNFMDSFMQLVADGSPDDWPEQKRRLEKLKSIHTTVNVDPEASQAIQ